jgi:superfamily II DNA or RNA helicase
MEILDNKKNDIQKKAVEAWINNNKIGTCEIITGLGKTFIALHCLLSMPKDEKMHLFLAEATDRKRDLLKDINKFNDIFGTDILNDYNLQFYCYQTVYKWKHRDFGLVISDEIHDSLSPSYSMFYQNNVYDAILGLSATIKRDTYYEKQDGSKFSKGELLDIYCPVIFKYNIEQGQKEGTSRKLKINVIYHELDGVNKTVKAGSKQKPFFQTERSAYEYWDKQFKKALFLEDEEVKNFKLRITSHKRSDLLYNLRSKIPIIKELLPTLKGKTIIFGNSISSLLEITPNVVSSKNTDDKNKYIRDLFENDKIDLIGSFKKLKQGANLKNLDNVIIISYYSTEKDIIQRLGRLRIKNDDVGTVIILCTKNTKEEDWLKKMFENMDSFDIQYFNDINEYLKNNENKRHTI